MPWNKDHITQLMVEAGATAERFKEDMGRELKSDRSVVTRADREIEALLARALERPDRGTYLIGEETVGQKGEEYIAKAMVEECYVVDPIDGTAPYAYRLPVWGISIGRMENGILTDGAVFLPDMGELLITSGDGVLQGTRHGGGWKWMELEVDHGSADPNAPVSITQSLAKRGKVLLTNPVLVLGAAVVPLAGLIQGRILAYLGSVKLWDVAGSIPMLMRKGFSVTVRVGEEIRPVTSSVDDSTYDLDPKSAKRWSLRSDLLVCHPGCELQLRAGLRSGDL